ncbi:MAG: hypothetical protein FWE23_06700 [Chitinivibrionia bacterium]|nr:hypothetical protein [Chitinivibrionia bacterium]
MKLDKAKTKEAAGGYFLSISVAAFAGGVIGGTFGTDFDTLQIFTGVIFAGVLFIIGILLKGGK